MKLKLPSKARAGRHCHLIQHYLYSDDDDDDDVSIKLMITGQREERERETEVEKESLPTIHGATDLPSFILPGPKCKVSAGLSPP